MQTPQNATIFEFLSRNYTEGSSELIFSYRVHFADASFLDFQEKITLSDENWATKLPRTFIEGIIEDLHIVLGISYYKLFLPPVFKTDIKLTLGQASFFNTLYKKGLGEFIYRNGLSFDAIAQFAHGEETPRTPSVLQSVPRSVLVGIGGGKDSIVSLELLKDYGRIGFEVATTKESVLIDEVAQLAGVPLMKMKRTLDPKVLEGVPHSYNGHVPISSVYAFLGVLQAALEKSSCFVVSNEHSSNFGNVVHEGVEVNHKWSGSSEFETLFQTYVREFLTPNISYFSLTRPFYELRVVRHFVELGEKYFHVFSSCNRNFAHTHDGKTRWCGVCPKCAFAFLMLAAFLPKEKLVSIFNKDLFEDETLLPLFKDLLGYGDLKPFDCVGTFDESRVALSLARVNFADATAVKELLPLLDQEELSSEVFKVQKASTVPSRFRMLGMESALILGYGREGHATGNYLKERLPQLRMGIADQVDGPEYLKKQHEYDITIKTPVIPSTLVKRHCTTATQLFFAEVDRRNIIGVTGSKGKSTTSTLTYLLLKKAGVRSHLVGNIGIPALQYLLDTPYGEDDIFVYELSSYQLEDLDVSPHVAVITSLFPEHIDHHGTLEAYYEAKRQIMRYQDSSDIVIHALGFPLLETWIKESAAYAVPEETLPFAISAMSLRGDHMRSNVALAYTIGKHYGVKDADAEAVINSFEGLPHRLQYVGTFKGIQFYDDSISTTPESAIAGIRALQNVGTIILGGVDRGYDFTLLEKELHESGIRNVVLFPESGEHMLSSETGFTVLHTASMEEAVQFAYEHTAEGKACLLSPAAPSYNLFTNFEERGKAFIDAIKKYAGV